MAEVGYLGSLQSKGIGTENSTQHLCQAMGEDLQQGQAFPHEARQRNKHPLSINVLLCVWHTLPLPQAVLHRPPSTTTSSSRPSGPLADGFDMSTESGEQAIVDAVV